jgi:hypothetical protein
MVSIVGVSVASVSVLPLFDIWPVTVGKPVMVNVCLVGVDLGPAVTVPVIPVEVTSLVQVPSGFTV